MSHSRRSAFLLRRLALAWLSLSLAGCAEELGPEVMPVAKVSGKVTDAGRPVTGGWIEFYPIDGTIGKPRAARLKEDGSFDTDGVAVGLNLIRVHTVGILKATDGKRVFSAFHSPIRRTIPAQPAGPLSIDLVDEAILHRDTIARALGPRLPGAGTSK
jgi:hypothetical protein